MSVKIRSMWLLIEVLLFNWASWDFAWRVGGAKVMLLKDTDQQANFVLLFIN